jgi:hypothetical protein
VQTSGVFFALKKEEKNIHHKKHKTALTFLTDTKKAAKGGLLYVG